MESADSHGADWARAASLRSRVRTLSETGLGLRAAYNRAHAEELIEELDGHPEFARLLGDRRVGKEPEWTLLYELRRIPDPAERRRRAGDVSRALLKGSRSRQLEDMLRENRGVAPRPRTRATRTSTAAKVAAFSTRRVRELIYESEGAERHVVAALLSCGHRVRYRPRSSASRTKTMPCPKCGSGSRPAVERQARRAAIEAAMRRAAADPRLFPHFVDLVVGSLDVLTIAPMTERQVEIWGKVERGIYGARLVDSSRDSTS